MSLSAASKEVIIATLPAVGGAIGDITPLFYKKLFAAHPELERDLFNRGNQKQGEQQKALAGAVAAYATMLVGDNPHATDAIMSRIANKHASLGITADSYPIVHTHLFAAIVEVLGEAVTPEVAAAWDEVYWLMANALIAAEHKLYEDSGVEDGQVWREVTVARKVTQSPETVSFVLASTTGEPLPKHLPGQYISVAVTLPDGARQIRQYSLVGAPGAAEWQITVKAVPSLAAAPAGEVSNFLHANVTEGDTLQASLPFGDLVLDEGDAPLLLISAGIGCTPMIGMLNHLAQTGDERNVAVLHADRSPAHHAHRAELSELVERIPSATMHRWYEDLADLTEQDTLHLGRADLSKIEIADGTRVYLCGPLPFMHSIRDTLIGRQVPADSIHYEVFGPDSWAPVG
ncbi:globin domain-containing protein [Rhodococcus gannanensis]|uniref:nitric oxide dioxygenase n=1 Tax=Rhodococcus gannanensis TaxID=1960308 RepID=A0ABW4NYH1_9NOCA